MTLTSGTGFSLKTQAARVDLEQAVLTGDVAVEGRWANGTVSAQGFRIEQSGRSVTFYGKPGRQVTGTLSGDNN